jgi:hypothetical protein
LIFFDGQYPKFAQLKSELAQLDIWLNFKYRTFGATGTYWRENIHGWLTFLGPGGSSLRTALPTS